MDLHIQLVHLQRQPVHLHVARQQPRARRVMRTLLHRQRRLILRARTAEGLVPAAREQAHPREVDEPVRYAREDDAQLNEWGDGDEDREELEIADQQQGRGGSWDGTHLSVSCGKGLPRREDLQPDFDVEDPEGVREDDHAVELDEGVAVDDLAPAGGVFR